MVYIEQHNSGFNCKRFFFPGQNMHAFPHFDKSLCHELAHGSIGYEKSLVAEQFTFFTIGKFAAGIQKASTKELLLLSIRLDYDAKAYPRKAYFFNALHKIVKSQLKKNG